MSGVLCDRKAPLSVKGKLHKVVVRPAMLYSTETLAVTQTMEKKLEVAEMRMLRFECGITRLDKVKGEEVRSKLKVGQLGVKMREGRLRWFGHVVRREKRYVGRRIMAMEVGKRKTQEEVEGLHKRGPESCGTGRSRRARTKKMEKMRPHQRPN